MSTCCSLKIWILFLWAERLQIKQSMRWSICSGENAFLQNFIDISAKKKSLFISTVEMLVILVCRDSWWIYQSWKRKSSNASRISDAIQRYFSTFTRTFFLKSTPHQRKEVSISKTIFISCSKRIAIRYWCNKNWPRKIHQIRIKKENVQIQSNVI